MRFKITISYNGAPYAGWQRQPRLPTVQGVVEQALERVAGQRVPIHGAGRTDAGVHAAGQVAHFDSEASLVADAWPGALNAFLPPDVRILACVAVSELFHARHRATGKLYRYAIDNQPIASPFLQTFCWHVRRPLDVAAMRHAGHLLEGPVNQLAFASRPEPGRTQRPLEQVRVDVDRVIAIRVAGRSFMRCVVRGIVGTLVQVGRGQRTPESVAALAASGDRAAAGPTAPAKGLCLVRIDYPSSEANSI